MKYAPLERNKWTVQRILKAGRQSFYRLICWTGEHTKYYGMFLYKKEAQKAANQLNKAQKEDQHVYCSK